MSSTAANPKRIRIKKCSVLNCTSNSLDKTNISYHKFPAPNGRSVYISDYFGNKRKVDQLTACTTVLKIRRLIKSMTVYSLHFKKEDYYFPGYGDSDNVDLSEMGVVNDSKFVLEWLIKTVNNSAPIFVWGHSLGTGVSAHVLAILANNGVHPAGLFLESPFNNLADEITEHPFAQVFKHLPWFHWVIVQPLYENELRFESDKHIGKIQCPVMILHAEDDNVVPFSLGEKLFISAKALHAENMQRIQMTRINSSYGLGHKYICRYRDLPRIIDNFVAQASAGATI